jgi:membrane protease YdiL (CAAX protease family)
MENALKTRDRPTEEADIWQVGKDAWFFVVLAFALAWTLWIVAIKTHVSEEWLNLGTSGPAFAAMYLASRRKGSGPGNPLRRGIWFMAVLAASWVVLCLHYRWRGDDNLEWHLSPLMIVPAMLPAWVLSGVASRNGGVFGLIRRLVHWPTRWSLLAFVAFPAFMLIPAAVVHFFHGHLVWPALHGKTTIVVSRAAMFLCYNILFVAVLEEPGWRGFLLDRLQARFSPLLSTMLVWFPWALWHGPLDYFRPVSFGWTNWLLVRVVFFIPLCIVLSWFYNRSGRSIQATVLFHAAMNTFPFVLPYSMPAFGLLFVWAGYAVVDSRMWRGPAMMENVSPKETS